MMKNLNQIIASLFIIFFTLSTSAFSDNVQLLVGDPSDTPSNSNTNCTLLYGNGDFLWNSACNVSSEYQKEPILGVFSDFKVTVSVAPGTGKSRTFQIFNVEAGSIALTCTISETATTCQDSGSYSLTTINKFPLVIVSLPSGTPATTRVQWTVKFRPFTSGERIISASNDADLTTTTKYFGLYGNATNTGDNAGGTYFPTSGNITALYVNVESSQSTTAKGWTFTLADDKSAGTLSCTVSGATTSCSATGTHAVGNVNDSVTLQSVALGSPTATRAWTGVKFVPNNHYVFTIHSSIESGIAGTGATRYIPLSAGSSTSTTTQNVRDARFDDDLVLRRFAARIFTVPGAGATRTFAIYKTTGGTDTATELTCTMNSATSTCSVNVNVEVNSTDTYAILSTYTGTPTSTGAVFGVEASFKRVMITK